MLDTYKKPKPRISIDETDLPAIKSWDVGQTYTVAEKMKMIHQAEGEEYYDETDGKKPKMRSTFKILSITPSKDAPKTTKKKGKMLMRVKA